MVDNAAALGVLPDRVVVAGDSAGANLAAVVARRARVAGLAMAAQVLVYPVADCDLQTESYRRFGRGFGLTRSDMRWFFHHYAPVAERRQAEISPVRAADLAGLAPAYVVTCEFDPLRDEGRAYAERLRAAGGGRGPRTPGRRCPRGVPHGCRHTSGLPPHRLTAGAAFHFDAPGARPPHAILLAVPPVASCRPSKASFDPTQPAEPLRATMATRAPDAVTLASRLGEGWRPPGLAGAQRKAFDAVAGQWQAWFTATHPTPGPSCWVRERLEHRFSVGAALDGEQVVLRAPEFNGGRLDPWHLEVDPDPDRSLGAVADADPPVTRQTKLPTQASYPGMPADRWWEFEDAAVNLPAITAGPADLARLLLVEYANVYGNDWWVIPVDLAVGSVHRITELVVTDTFGIEPTDDVHDDGWSMFRMTDRATGRPGPAVLALLPTATNLIEAEPVEEVLFVRDEMANLAWAVERIVEGAPAGAGAGLTRHPTCPPAAGRPIDGALVYHLMAGPPAHWMPLVPVLLAEGSAATQFRRAQIPRFAPDGTLRPKVGPAGTVLEPGSGRVTFREEEIPRAGVRVSRVPVLAHWRGGTTAAWTSRRAQAGRGEGSSNLRFDEAQE